MLTGATVRLVRLCSSEDTEQGDETQPVGCADTTRVIDTEVRLTCVACPGALVGTDFFGISPMGRLKVIRTIAAVLIQW